MIVKPIEILPLEVQPIATIIFTSQPKPSVHQREEKGIVTDDQPEVQRKLVPVSKESALPFVPKQAPSVSLGRKRKRMKLEPEIKVHGLECNRGLPNGVSFINNMVIEEPEPTAKGEGLRVAEPEPEGSTHGYSYMLERAEVYYKCMEPFKSLMRLWVMSRSIAAIWLENVITPLTEPAIKGFAAASVVLKLEHFKVDKHVCEGSCTLEDCVMVRFID
nr:hypothetical protein [Tanacetum cinerariifolium]